MDLSDDVALKPLRDFYFASYGGGEYARARDHGVMDADSLRTDFVAILEDLGEPEPGTSARLVRDTLAVAAIATDWERLLGFLDWDFGYGADL